MQTKTTDAGNTVQAGGSTFATGGVGDVISNSFPIDVQALQLVFDTEPQAVVVGMPFAVSVLALDLNSNLDLDYADHTNITPSPGTDCSGSSACTGKTVGDVVRFNGVVTVGSTTVDAVVTTRPSAGPEATGVVTRYERSSSFDEDGKFEFRVDGPTSTTPGMVGFLFEFYLAGTYTGPGTGVPVTLLNLGVVVDDIDPLQFFQFSAVDGYSVADPTDLVYDGANRRFSSPTDTVPGDDAERAYVELSAASAVELWGGTEDGDSSTFQVTFGPATWTGSTTSTGPVVAESLAISAASSVPTIGWSSSPGITTLLPVPPHYVSASTVISCSPDPRSPPRRTSSCWRFLTPAMSTPRSSLFRRND